MFMRVCVQVCVCVYRRALWHAVVQTFRFMHREMGGFVGIRARKRSGRVSCRSRFHDSSASYQKKAPRRGNGSDKVRVIWLVM